MWPLLHAHDAQSIRSTTLPLHDPCEHRRPSVRLYRQQRHLQIRRNKLGQQRKPELRRPKDHKLGQHLRDRHRHPRERPRQETLEPHVRIVLLFNSWDATLTCDSIAGYFTDLKDGVHKGDADDPRVSVIKVAPNEIRYWVATSGAVGRALEHAKGAVTGKLTAPGEIRTITSEEVRLPSSRTGHLAHIQRKDCPGGGPER